MAFTTAPEEERDEIVRKILLTIPKRGFKKDEGFRIVITGKGGVGKTVLSAIFSYKFAKEGLKVLAVDEDPQTNLPMALGLPGNIVEKIIPLNKQLDYIEEKTGARPGTGWGLFIRLNPDVDDVVERFGIKINDNLSLLVMGTVVQAAVGCTCPENDLLEAVMNYISLKRNEVIVMDTEAGLEQFGRAVSRGFHHAIIVSEPTYTSISVSLQAAKLANDLRIPFIHLVINKIRNREEEKKVLDYLKNKNIKLFHTIDFLPYDDEIYKNEPSVIPIVNNDNSEFMIKFNEIFRKILRLHNL
ncbi:MAG: AAA family ATPase [Nitrososphaeria archaeon]